MARISAVIVIMLAFLGLNAHAHVKWFVEEEGGYAHIKFTFDMLSLLVVSGAIAFLLLASFAEFNTSFRSVKRLLYTKLLPDSCIYSVVQGSVLILLLGNIIQGHFIAPNIPVAHHSQLEPLAQAGLVLILVFSGELFALATLILCAGLVYLYGLDVAIDYIFELAAIALALCLIDPSRRLRLLHKLSDSQRVAYALTSLRFGLGVQLCVLTVHDKLLHPGLAMQFLDDYPYFNFMKLFGFDSFSNLHFVLSAGLAEFCFGLLLITNIAQRLSLACICFFFTLSGLVLGPSELLGHVPIFIVALVLFVNPAPSLNIGDKLSLLFRSSPLFEKSKAVDQAEHSNSV